MSVERNISIKAADLPDEIALFPLNGATLFPNSRLLLNVFEPRYLNMIDDTHNNDEYIGLIQLADAQLKASPRKLAGSGCACKLVNFSETSDGRYLIEIEAVCRFSLVNEITVKKPYRVARVDYNPYLEDLTRKEHLNEFECEELYKTLQGFSEVAGFEFDLPVLRSIPPRELLDSLCTHPLLSVREKQGLLETPDIHMRCELMIGLIEMHRHNFSDGYLQ